MQGLSALRERTELACLDDLGTCQLPLAAVCRSSLATLVARPPPP